MATPTTASPSPAPSRAPSKPSSKSKQKFIVKLRISSDLLARFQSDAFTSITKPKATPIPPTSPYESGNAITKELQAADEDQSATNASQAKEGTPSGTTQVNGVKRKAAAGGENASKKQKVGDDGDAKPRPKAAPKRRKVVDAETGAPISSHKINPKANTGVINANLRALDLTKKAPRKWQKRGLHFTSFTGKTWDVPRWNSHMKSMNDATYDGDYTSNSTPSDPQAKHDPASSNLPSENGEARNGTSTPLARPATDLASSPQSMAGLAAA